jgi:outer membrane lipopolysaccharide assembly protein LptE/RlpB
MGDGRWAETITYCLLPVAYCLALAGCGYQFKVEGAGPTIGGSGGDSTGAAASKLAGPAPRLVVPNFQNKTFEPNLELKFTNYTRHEFSAGGGVQVVTNKEAADLVLKGEIIGVTMPSLSFTQSDTFESRVVVTVKAVVEDARSGKVVWDQRATAASEFFITNDLQFNRVLQNRALEQAGRLIAEDLATRFLNHLESGAKPAAATTGAPSQAEGSNAK